ncbi:hypothetical protein NQ318_022805 [Aromia moschata]|uniref:DUF5641 domain-containing protein n=1 Tax=Aromia moschata TaxID=1265417 RepID=A0AAV8XPG2_9CUCU|nr:hypothetical protein NQ318_022805 [Aromia moschata]
MIEPIMAPLPNMRLNPRQPFEVVGVDYAGPTALPLSDSPHSFNPFAFLVGRPLTCIPEKDARELPVNRLSLYQHLLQIKQHLWDRWSKEYVNELQQRTKWKVHHDSLKLGSLVLVKEDNQPPMRWKLGRVEAIHAGRDGVVR